MKTTQTLNKQIFAPQNPLLVTTRVKILLTFLTCLVVSLLAVYIVRQQYILMITNKNETVSTLLDAERVKSIKTGDADTKTNEAFIKSQLQQTRGVNSDVKRFYLLATTPEGKVFYLVDSLGQYSSLSAARGEAYENATDNLRSAFYSKASYIFGPVKQKQDSVLTVISPVYDATGLQIAVIGMDLSPATYYSVLTASVLLPILAGLLVSGVFLATDAIRKHRQESVRMQSELVSIASHELRTPLTGIRWSEESLLASKLIAENREVIQTMYDSTLRLQESIEDILQLANWQSGRRQEVVKTSTDISEMMRGIFATQKLPAAQRDIKLEFAAKWPKKLLINCDGQRMKRVFNNLLSNAIKYARPGTDIVVGYQKVDGNHLLTIKDHGIGIPKDEQEKVFAGFYRATNAVSKETSGTGMGLYMSRSAVEQHGGKLWLHSEEGKGTTVYIQLP